jgi:hypothetical protein
MLYGVFVRSTLVYIVLLMITVLFTGSVTSVGSYSTKHMGQCSLQQGPYQVSASSMHHVVCYS